MTSDRRMRAVMDGIAVALEGMTNEDSFHALAECTARLLAYARAPIDDPEFQAALAGHNGWLIRRVQTLQSFLRTQSQTSAAAHASQTIH